MHQTKIKSILVSIVHHPIERGNSTIVEVPYRHQNLIQLKEQFARGQDILVGLDGKQVELDARCVSPGSKVVFVPAAAGPVIAALVSAIVWAAPYIALSLAISYLGGVLFGQDVKQPERRQEREESRSFGWNPRTIQREGIPHPMCYGTNLHYGNIVARWTDVDENGDEILHMILDYGRGPVQGRGSNTVYFNDQPSSHFPDVTLQERLGTLNQTCMTGFEQNKLEYRPTNTKITYDDGPVTWTTPNNFFDDIEYTLEWSRGLWHYQNDGSRVSHGVGVKVEISERDQNDWTTLMDTTVDGNQLTPLYKAYSVRDQGFNCVHGKQYDLKYTKTTEDEEIDKWGDELVLRSIREVVSVAFTRPGKALLGITALGTQRLSGHIDVKWIADDRLVRVFNGTSWGVAFSRNRAWVELDELTQPVIGGDGGANPWTIERYEGLDPSRIDLGFYYEWAEWCDQQVPDGNGGTEDRMTCDVICDWQTDIWSLMYELAQIGRMYPYWQGNILTGWIDKAVTDDPIDLVTFDNIMARSWKSSWAGYGEMAGAVEIFYRDSLHGYERKPLPIPNEDAGLYNRIVAIEGIGVTGHALATRVGNHALTRNKLIKNVNSTRMFKSALRYKLGQVVRLQSNVPNWGKSYKVIKSEADNTVELDRTCDASADELLYVRSYDEENKKVSTNSYTVASVIDKVVTIEETWDVTPAKTNIVAIGKAGSIKLRRIINMRHTADNYFEVEFETYDEELFDPDDIIPAIDNPNYAWPAPASELTKPITKWEVVDLINQMLPPQPDIEIPWLSNCNWPGNEVDTVSWAKRDANEPILFRYRGVTYEITPDSTTDEFIYWDPAYTTQFRTTNLVSIAFVVGKWVMCRNKDGVAYPATPMQLLHAGIIQAGTITASQIIISGINALALANAPAEAGADVTGHHEGDISIENITDGTTYKKYTNTEKTKLTGVETGADVTADHADDVVYRGNTPPAHKAGRVWYCLVNESYDDYTLYKSTGAAWQVISDTTAQHQADVQLANVSGDADDIDEGSTNKFAAESGADVTGDHEADIALANLGEKSIDSLVDATYAKMLAVWKHSSDPTKMDLGKGFAASITTAQIGVLAVHTAQINNLAVTEGKIGALAITDAKIGNLEVKTAKIDNLTVTTGKVDNEAIAVREEAYTDGEITLGIAATIVQTLSSVNTLGDPVTLTVDIDIYSVGADRSYAVLFYEGGNLKTTRYTPDIGAGKWLTFVASYSYTPTTGNKTYYIKIARDLVGDKAQHRRFTIRSDKGK